MSNQSCKECRCFKKGSCPNPQTKSGDPVCGAYVPKSGHEAKTCGSDKPKFIRSEIIQMSQLEPHPDAMAFWAAHREKDVDEDSMSLLGNIEEMGVMEPLMVVEKYNSTGYWIVDGCSRYLSADEAGLEAVPCSVYEMNLDLVRNIAYGKNVCRHRFTTGERVMRYLDLNRVPVLKAWKAAQNDTKFGKNGTAVSRDTAMTSDSIASRLGCSKKDVLKGIELLASINLGGLPKKDSYGRVTIIPCEKPMQDAIRHCFASVMAGSTPIRRWNAALQGKAATENKERSATDYGSLMNRSCVSLANCFENWDSWYKDEPGQKKLEIDLKAKIFETSLKAMLEAAPEQVRNYALKIWGVTATSVKGKTK